MPLALALREAFYPSQSVYKGSRQKAHQEIQATADEKNEEVEEAFIEANQNIVSQVSLDELSEAINRSGPSAVDTLFPISAVDNSYDAVWPVLLGVYALSGQRSMKRLPRRISLNLSFNLVNPRAVEFAQTYKFELIRGLSQNTRDGVKRLIVDAVSNGVAPRQVARQIKMLDGFGLTQRQAISVNNFRQNMETQLIKQKLRADLGVKHLPSGAFNFNRDRALLTQRELSIIDKRVATYQKRSLKRRAESIARTETIRAANRGQIEAWKQAQDAGLLSNQARHVWVLTPDDRTCPICRGIKFSNPKGVPVGQPFKYSSSFPPPITPVLSPAAHTHCRCAVALLDEDGSVISD